MSRVVHWVEFTYDASSDHLRGQVECPQLWNDQASAFLADNGRRPRVLCVSDVFAEGFPTQKRRDLFALILSTPNLDWMLLTGSLERVKSGLAEVLPENFMSLPSDHPIAWLWSHLWIGTRMTNQGQLDREIIKLLEAPAHARFLYLDPLTGQIDLECYRPRIYAAWGNALTGKWRWDKGPTRQETAGLDLVVVGKTNTGIEPEWEQTIRNQCHARGVEFHSELSRKNSDPPAQSEAIFQLEDDGIVFVEEGQAIEPTRDYGRVTEEGRAIGSIMTQFAEPWIEKLKQEGEEDERCKSCAFREGTVPNGCLQTQMDVIKAVIEDVPFLCHQKDHLGSICHGWFASRVAITSSKSSRRPFPFTKAPWEFSPPDTDKQSS